MSEGLIRLINELQGNMEVIGRYMENSSAVLDEFNVQGKERALLLTKDVEGLNALGLETNLAEGWLSGAHSRRCSITCTIMK